MTRLRKMMLDELERRNYTQTTRKAYLFAVEQFAKHFGCSPDKLGLNHIRDYQVHLFRVKKLKPARYPRWRHEHTQSDIQPRRSSARSLLVCPCTSCSGAPHLSTPVPSDSTAI